MARVKLTEFRAKKLLVENYKGAALVLDTLDADISSMKSRETYVIKVDQGIKKRGKQGLIRLNVTKNSAAKAVREIAARGDYSRFIAEPMFAHEDVEEHYLCIERVRNGYKFLYSPVGGVSVEEHAEAIQQFTTVNETPLPTAFLSNVLKVMDSEHISFLEINPLVVRDDTCTILDAAVLVDSAGDWQASWDENDIVDTRRKTTHETAIAELNSGSPASFSFRVLNQDGAIWLLLSGGGASITIADEAANRGKAHLIGNYGEYSGGPTREETQLYTEAVIEQMLKSTAKKKAIVLAGGVANFTDVKKTFTGIIDAFTKHIDVLKKKDIKVYVRRGGPNEKEGLLLMSEFLTRHGIFGSVHGSDTVLTTVVDEALEFVHA